MWKGIFVLNIFQTCIGVNESDGRLFAVIPIKVRGSSLVKHAATSAGSRFQVESAALVQLDRMPRMEKAARHMGLEMVVEIRNIVEIKE